MGDACNAFELNGIGVRRGERWILRGIDWSVAAGSCAAILGANGSGKSTLTRVIGCHLWPSEGEAMVLGGRFGRASLPELRESIRLVQAAGPYDVEPSLTALEVIETGFFGTIGLYHAVTREQSDEAGRIAGQVGLGRVIDHAYSTLSSGERVRALLGRALVARPKLLLLDEATSGLDLLAREQVLATVEALFHTDAPPPTVVMVTHHVEELPPATGNVLLLDDGRVAASGRPEEVLQGEILSRAYRCPVQVRREGGRYALHVHPDAWEGLLKT
jgi:iron complex transport system ATP-binding protein